MKLRNEIGVALLVLGMVFTNTSCKKETPVSSQKSYLEIPVGFSNMTFPIDNQFTNERWALGKKLFFDPVLSLDSSISCATCHEPNLAFADNKKTTPGIFERPGVRNAPSLANVGYFPYFLKEGGVPTLEMQVLVPIDEHNEFGFNVVELTRKLQRDPKYMLMANQAYDREIDPFVITRAIATFERSLISGNSIYDKYVIGNPMVLNPKELQGMSLFFSSKTNCFSCHGGELFTDHSFQSNGLYQEYTDIGRMRLTQLTEDRGKFKVPSLRNVGLTAPYMHDGSLETLSEVIAHYNKGGENHANKNELIRPLGLSKEERDALEAFLHTLSDYSFINDTRWN